MSVLSIGLHKCGRARSRQNYIMTKYNNADPTIENKFECLQLPEINFLEKPQSININITLQTPHLIVPTRMANMKTTGNVTSSITASMVLQGKNCARTVSCSILSIARSTSATTYLTSTAVIDSNYVR